MISIIKIIFNYIIYLSLLFSTMTPAFADITYVGNGMSEAEIKARHPDAKIIRTSKEQYPVVAKSLSDQGYAVQNNTTSANSTYIDDCNKNSGNDKQSTDSSIRAAVEITDDILNSSTNSNSKSTALVFVIIGTVVVVVWAIYVLKYMVDLATGFKPCSPWYEFTVVSSFMSNASFEKLDLLGMRFMTGFRDEQTDIGIALELGKADVILKNETSTNFSGNYWLLGPVLKWHLGKQVNSSTLQMSFMGGTAEGNNVDFLARANLGFQFALSDSFHLGLNWGVMNIELNNDQGIISARDDYEYFFGVNSGVSF